jgi:acylglycerol lipase
MQRFSAQPNIPLFLIGHSMGGGVALTYAYSGAHREKLAGCVVWSPMIDTAPETRPLSLVVAAGRIAAKVFPGHKLVNKLDGSFMSRDPTVCEEFAKDTLCHDTGTLLGIAEMLDRGKKLMDPEVGKRFPQELPMLVLHGSGDKITCCKASRKFTENLKVRDKTFKEYEGWYHKLHAEPEEDRIKFANDVVDWVKARCTSASAGNPKL